MSKKLFIIVGLMCLTINIQAQAWAEKWEWPLDPEWQSYTVGEDNPNNAFYEKGHWYLKNSKKPTDPQAVTGVAELIDQKKVKAPDPTTTKN